MYGGSKMYNNPGTAEERKTLIDLESHVKEARAHLEEALNMIDILRADMGTWELAHYMYSGLENCDKALEMIFSKECAAEKGPDMDYFTYYGLRNED